MINCILIAAVLVLSKHSLSSLLMPRQFLIKLHEVFGYIIFISRRTQQSDQLPPPQKM